MHINRLKCHLENTSGETFFSLVDYRNNLFMSDKLGKIIEFYNSFNDQEELIQWMRERPKGASYVHQVEGDKEVIVVIPTADFEGKYAKTCRDEIFKGLHIIFVESGNWNFYFNYAHNCNVGITIANRYNPKWIILSNDDMYMIDDSETLRRVLSQKENTKYDVIFTKPSKYHSIPVYFGRQNFLRKIIFGLNYWRLIQLALERKFGVHYFSSPVNDYGRYFFRHDYKHISIADFAIFSSSYVNQHGGVIFDETYVNAGEDIDLSLELALNPHRSSIINYRIGDKMGSTLGTGIPRKIRDITGHSYLNYKVMKDLHPASAVLNKYLGTGNE